MSIPNYLLAATFGGAIVTGVNSCRALNPEEAKAFHSGIALSTSLQNDIEKRTALICTWFSSGMIWRQHDNTLFTRAKQQNNGYDQPQLVATSLPKETSMMQNAIDKNVYWESLKQEKDCK